MRGACLNLGQGAARRPKSCREARAHALWLCLAALLSGCAAGPPEPVSLQSWQRGLERYVWDQGNGDPNVLRDTSWDDVHAGFAIISDPLPDRSTDAIGLLLAHRRIEGRQYFLFLFGLLRSADLEDLRPVALNVERGQFHWVVARSEPASTAIYRRMTANGGKSACFPAPSDLFGVQVAGNRLIVVHSASGAAWHLTLPAAPAATGRSPI